MMVLFCFLLPNILSDDQTAERVLVSTVASVTNAAAVSLRGNNSLFYFIFIF